MAANDLVSLSWCKDLLSLDDRDDTFTNLLINSCSQCIERHLLRRIRERTYTHHFDSYGQKELLLPEYPVREIRTIHCDPDRLFGETTKIEPSAWFCATVPYDVLEDLPVSIIFDSFLSLTEGPKIIRVVYIAGYPVDNMPEDLRLAAAELVAWNFKRIKTKQIGVNGLLSMTGKTERTTFEIAMPANVREMLEPYRRRTL